MTAEWVLISDAPRDGSTVVYWSERYGAMIGCCPPGYDAGDWVLDNNEWRGHADVRAVRATHACALPPYPTGGDL